MCSCYNADALQVLNSDQSEEIVPAVALHPTNASLLKSFDARIQSQAERLDAQVLCNALEQQQRAVLESLSTEKHRQQTQLNRAFRKQYLCDRRA